MFCPIPILSHTAEAFCAHFRTHYGKGEYHAHAAYRSVMKTGNMEVSHLPEFEKSSGLARQVEADLRIDLPELLRSEEDGGTTKLALKLADGSVVESVIVPMKTYHTLCVSTQVGCRMGCAFCETGRMGLIRNLEPHEITGQLFLVRHRLGVPVKNIVFMGMGEPFDNLDNLFSAIAVLSDQRGLDVALSHMTVSTAGRTDGIRALGQSGFRRMHLAVSVNAPNDTIRSRLMPVNRKYPMAELKRALQEFPLRPGGAFLIEYVLIPGENDAQEHAEELAEFVRDLPVRVNLIPHNPIAGGPWPSPSDEEVHRFAEALASCGVFVRNRWEKGRGLAAACGQLGRDIMKTKPHGKGKQ